MNYNLLLKFYNEISGNDFDSIEQIPQKVLEFLLLMDIDDLKKPFARKAILQGKPQSVVCIAVGLNRFKIRRLV